MFSGLFSKIFKSKEKSTRTIADLDTYAPEISSSSSSAQYDVWNGDKFDGSFGVTQLQQLDYWTLRARSSQLFNENLYARGFIRRLVTNEIGTGLTPESSPEEEVIGVPDDSMTDWTEIVENRFGIWAKSPMVCDHNQLLTFGQIQQQMRIESLIEGDILSVMRHDNASGMPNIQLIPGSKIRSPFGEVDKLASGHVIVDGIEKDKNGRHIAFYIVQEDGTTKRLAARGSRSGRLVAKMIYGTEKRTSEDRGTPLLALMLQSLKEIDRYRDSTQRKATINSIMAMFIEKGDDKMGTLPMQGGAKKTNDVEIEDGGNGVRKLRMADMMPGLIAEELQTNEKPVMLGGQGTDVNFGTFEESIIQAVAWANEVPPEILTMSFSSNYSASQAAINEFKMYLNKQWAKIGENFCDPIYQDWLISSVLMQKFEANGFLEAWRDKSKYDVFGAWVLVDWYGSIKPSTDMVKSVKASDALIASGLSTRAREARINTGTKYSKNVKRLKKENEQLVEANSPIVEFNQKLQQQDGSTELDAIEDIVVDAIENLVLVKG